MGRKRAEGMRLEQFLNLYTTAKAEGWDDYAQMTARMMKIGGYASPAVAYTAYKRFARTVEMLAKGNGENLTFPDLRGKPDGKRKPITWDTLHASYGTLLGAMTAEDAAKQAETGKKSRSTATAAK